MTVITRELPHHYDAIRRLTIDAFSACSLGHHGEADLIDAVRSESNSALSLVAIEGSRVVGHILFSPAIIRTQAATFHGMGLGPMAVLPSHQGRGIGSMLVREGLNKIAETSSLFTIVAGHPDFYPRFGFLPARNFAITHGFEGMPQDILFLRTEEDPLSSAMCGGLAYYHQAFGPQHVE